ncbi:glycosyl hydrolase family 8 [Anaeromyxobacter dehalogenans]|uniref:cellulase n=1 Tax=Anaeromyxobacter dehalogenans (strain 2CP-C) TaxID=290397 RepID=Q2IJH4_ANADE|nr:glycosyl hydrolase family 8 [Anaeromyxobacter dehalogenans]ABC81801.1 glycosyl transferase, family 2 [Anaeromyxobacter dehalogenans 2CP-C]
MRPTARNLAPLLAVLCAPPALLAGCGHAEPRPRAAAQDRDGLSALWSYYRYTHVQGGRVAALDEGGVTTSEGQGYAMLRAVWMDDRATLDAVWRWTRENLAVREDRLLAWRWLDGKVKDRNAATDADQDVALALVLASRRFGDPRYLEAARPLLADIWAREVIRAGGRWLPTGGNWAPAERYPTLHVAYLAPYAYQVFADVDPERPWAELVESSYQVLRFLMIEKGLALPPERIWVDPRTGELLLARPGGQPDAFGYDAVPVYWRVALDARWFGRRGEAELRARLLRFPAEAFRDEGRLRERYTTSGRPLSELDGLPHLASVQALAQLEDPELARAMRASKLDALFDRALSGEATPYYLHNWLWFGRALEAGLLRRFDEPLAFLSSLDWGAFRDRFPLLPVALAVVLAPLARRLWPARAALVALALGLSIRYLAWRAGSTLNFVEPLGPALSLALLAAEAYALSTVALLVVQVGLRHRARPPEPPLGAGEPHPSVDVMVPIYSEPLDILDKTLAACAALRYPRKTIVVCDDSHREEVARLAAEHGARYLAGPRRHAKAGNLNAALARTDGELVVVFDTDHVPTAAFLERTVPCFRDPRLGVVQTPHHFYNPDVFQRALGAPASVPNEADLFNHAIQGGRDRWGGAFFVGSGAVFRREALASVGGFHLLSITEDIHTSQKLHAGGWRTRFVDEDLAAGLSAEDLASYVVQRRRWMLGCLQIFFRDNPLLQRGLPLRHRLGYLASLWYFFFPLARLVFFATPLAYLLFHLHPLFAELPVLLAYLVPHLVAAPLAASALVPGWPRLLWGGLYEGAVAFPLARATLDLLLPRRLGFKVTPKGVRSERRRFDLRTSAFTLAAAAVGLLAIAKGAAELWAFGIEVEAYAFNLAWAGANLVSVLLALLVAWERPQRREDERIRRRVPVRLEAPGLSLEASTLDLARGGAAVALPPGAALPAEVEVTFDGPEGLRLRARVAYVEPVDGAPRAGLAFQGVGAAEARALVRIAFSADGAHAGAHDGRSRWQAAMAWHLLAGLWRAVRPLRPRRRLGARRRTLRPLRLCGAGRACRALAVDASAGGLGLVAAGARGAIPAPGTALALLAPEGIGWARVVHARRILPGLWRLGLALQAEPVPGAEPHAYLAA